MFESIYEIPRMKVGKKQKIETLINEEALLLAKFLRFEREKWKPRIVIYARTCAGAPQLRVGLH